MTPPPHGEARGRGEPAGPPAPRRDAIRWHVQTAGSGPALLLVHGTGSSSESFRALTPLLAERFTVVAPDLPGHAGSEAPPWFRPTLPESAAALGELLATRGIEPAVAVGHSAGAALLIRLAIDRAIDPRLVVALAPALVPLRPLAYAVLPSAARLLAFASARVAPRAWSAGRVDRLIRSTGSALEGPGVEHYRRLLERPGHVTATLSMMAHWDLTPLFDDLPALATPLLLLAGARDRAVPLAHQRLVAGRAPRARLEVVGGAGHLLHEERPAAVARLILDEADALAHEKPPQGRPEAGPPGAPARLWGRGWAGAE
ncbi:MAG TPA: alpha/beta fold hydrolase BchO [Polyangiaceae bacterium]|nr:alpha/beta fold hydrolase BchO [Polyangiaceae bacterium]